jgi:hypothetical protein
MPVSQNTKSLLANCYLRAQFLWFTAHSVRINERLKTFLQGICYKCEILLSVWSSNATSMGQMCLIKTYTELVNEWQKHLKALITIISIEVIRDIKIYLSIIAKTDKN